MIHEMFARSLSKYDFKYTSYVGDGDAKVHKHLLANPPYPGTTIKKIEDVNHFAKRMLARITKIRQENKNKLLEDGKKFIGKGRMTNAHAIKFKIFFAKAIREEKNDLTKLYKKSWAIFKHYYSCDDEPMHEWCDQRWCKYLQAKANAEAFTHRSSTTIPRACLDLIKPVFNELCSYSSLERVVGAGSQNANESFHSLVWTMAPKHRYCSSTILRLALGLSTIVYNDGYQALGDIFHRAFSAVGFYSTRCFINLDRRRDRSDKKKRNRKSRTGNKTTIATNTTDSSADSDDGVLSANNQLIVNSVSDHDLGRLLDMNIDDGDDYEPGGDE